MRQAFTMLHLNRQNFMLEQLMTDNENLIDQIQQMKAQPSEIEVSISSPAKEEQDGYGMLNNRDQTPEPRENTQRSLNATGRTENNRSNKDLSPSQHQHQQAKGTAFMRSTDDSNLHTMIP